MKRPCILFREAQYAALQRAGFPTDTDFQAPRDMEVEAVWMSATGLLRLANAEGDIDLNFHVKNRLDVVQGDVMPMRMFDTGRAARTVVRTGDGKGAVEVLTQEVTERSFGWSQFGWQWVLKHAYRLKRDAALNVECLNQIPVIGPVNADRIGFSAHGIEAGETGRGQRELMLFGTIARAATAPQKILQAQRTSSPDGKVDIDLQSIGMIRGDSTLWPAGTTSIPRPRWFYVRVCPVGREQWSETMVPLPAYGVTANPDESSGVFWRPQSSLILPQGYSFAFDIRNNSATRVRIVQIAVLGYVEEE